jgi:hypothetical protein
VDISVKTRSGRSAYQDRIRAVTNPLLSSRSSPSPPCFFICSARPLTELAECSSHGKSSRLTPNTLPSEVAFSGRRTKLPLLTTELFVSSCGGSFVKVTARSDRMVTNADVQLPTTSCRDEFGRLMRLAESPTRNG